MASRPAPGHSISSAVAVTPMAALSLVVAMTGLADAAGPKQSVSRMTTAKVTMQPVAFAELPGWESDDHAAAFAAFLKSCDRILAAVKSGTLPASAVPQAELLSACDAARVHSAKSLSRSAARSFFETQFTPHRVMHQAAAGLLTGYYEPVLEGARQPERRFHVPIYRRPPDLVNVVSEAERGAKSHLLTHVRKTAAGTEPFPTRAEIEQGALANQGLELLYLADPVETFFMHIQGSGRIKLTDGTTIRIHYDGKNGHPYTSIGRYLIDTAQFAADKVSMQSLKNWLRTDPERGRKVMWQNASFVFFRELKGAEANGPLGTLNIPLTPGRSLAVDTAYHALGTPIYVTAPTLTHATKGSGYRRLMIAQDVGSAIKGPERGDIYYGSGDKAGKLAGTTKHPGNFFVLLPRNASVVQPSAEARQ